MANNDRDPRDEPPPYDSVTGEVLSADQPDRPGTAVAPLPELSLAADLTRAEIDQQIATAHRFPRVVSEVQKAIETLATLDFETAQECIYSLSRKGPDGQKKAIIGPSVRFAEIVLQAWGNCRVASRITNQGKTHLEATGIYHDLQSNMALARSVPVRITTSSGRRYGDDMIGVASAAGVSKALRNAVLAGVPKGVWRKGYEKALAVVAGTAETLERRRHGMVTRIASEFGGTPQEVLLVIGVADLADITIARMIEVSGLYTSLTTGEVRWADVLAEAKAAAAPAGPREGKTLADANGPKPAEAKADPAPKAGEKPKEEPKPAATRKPAQKPAQAKEPAPAPVEPETTTEPAGEPETGSETVEDEATVQDQAASDDDTGYLSADQDEDDDDGMNPDWVAFLGSLTEAGSWVDIRTALSTLSRTDYFKGAEAGQQNLAFAHAWATMERIANDDAPRPDVGKDAGAFRSWLEWTTDPDAIEAAWAKLASSAQYAKIPQGGRDDLINAKKARKNTLREEAAQ